MYDKQLFMKTLSRFSVVLPEHHDLDAAALAELTKSVTAVLGLGGSVVAIHSLTQLWWSSLMTTIASVDTGRLQRGTMQGCQEVELTNQRSLLAGIFGESTRAVARTGVLSHTG